jgi:hypothetical protein
MSEFAVYFGIGKDHILDYANGYDHILFVIALCAVYVISDWKKILVLVTSFTVGHSITLALATFQIISINPEWVEFLIPFTIFFTGVSNMLIKSDSPSTKKIQVNYFLALFFGLIHGMGFSNYLRALLGKSSGIISQLFAFNIGLEVGQIIVVAIFLSFGFLLVNLMGVNRKYWKMVVSSIVAGIALILMKDRIFW